MGLIEKLILWFTIWTTQSETETGCEAETEIELDEIDGFFGEMD